ncbi:FliH/SctL family protein [Oceanibacterium hippocampi]|uniref:Flagellar assembly protein H n=1 Tax=Oceanibacterium hippocampi TaxID=745714 RepID=A0A1Y5TR15_9PROT|nr:FliH/SctL family protein [Oceanibacterium hippocampi]SLN69529.1 flagellar assembly protein H [Oceanibacterium hippocampi]
MQAGKFLFDREFGAGEVVKAKPKPKPVHTDDDLAAAREAAHAEGVRAGAEQARAGIETVLVQTLETVSAQFQTLAARHEESLREIRAEAAGLAFEIASKLAQSLTEREPLAEIERLIADCLEKLQHEPRVVVRAAEPICEALGPRIDAIARDKAFAGQMVIIPADDMAPGDCRVEWADGGAERDREALEQSIGEAVSRYVASKQSA